MSKRPPPYTHVDRHKFMNSQNISTTKKQNGSLQLLHNISFLEFISEICLLYNIFYIIFTILFSQHFFSQCSSDIFFASALI